MFFFGKKNTENEAEVLNEPQQADETVEKIVLNEEGLELEFTQTEGAGNEVLPVDEAVPVGSVDEVPDEAAEETECMPEAQENEPAPSMQDGAEPEGEVCVPVDSGNCCEDACGQLEKRVSGLHETMCRMQSLLGAMYQNQQQMGMVQDSVVRGMQALQDKVENVV